MKYILSLGVMLAATAAGAAGQGPTSVQTSPDIQPVEQAPQTFRSWTSMVALNVTVSDGHRFITGLTADDFELYEDGVRQEVRFFETANVPLDLILLIDASSSMRDKMPVVHDAARSFMTILRPGDRGAVVAFNDRVNILRELTDDPKAIEDAIASTHARGATSLHNAIYIALKQFGRNAVGSEDVRRQAIAVLSDGEDTSSLVTFDDVLAVARKTGVNVYTIGLQSSYDLAGSSPDRRYFSEANYTLNMLARETGAQAFFPSSVHQLRDVYKTIANELVSQYALAYAPTNTRADGRFRRIIVRVTADPSYTPRTRKGYLADSADTNSASHGR